jgi:hypothetical protein
VIALLTEADCQYCPYSLICLGDAWSTEIARHASLRACQACHAVFFNAGHKTYLCTMVYWKRQHQHRTVGFAFMRVTTGTQRCDGCRGDGTRYAKDCLELYKDHLERPTP